MAEIAGTAFAHEQLSNYAHEAMMELAPKYLGDEALMLHSALSYEVVNEDDQAEPVPLTRYDNRTRSLRMCMVPEVILGYAEDIQDVVNHDTEIGDIAKVLVGAGIARCIVGWKATKSMLDTEDQQDRYKELLCRKEDLWAACDSYDDEQETVLRLAIERLGDGQIIRVNILRFALGASLTHLCDSMQLQQSMVEHMRGILLEAEAQRQVNLKYNLGWLDAKSAFTIYDDTTPELELAFSFPMSPREELLSFATDQ